LILFSFLGHKEVWHDAQTTSGRWVGVRGFFANVRGLHWVATDGRAFAFVLSRAAFGLATHDRDRYREAKIPDDVVVKYFLSNAPTDTPVETLIRVAFCRWNVEHAFRVVKTEISPGGINPEGWTASGHLIRNRGLIALKLRRPRRPL